MKIGTWNALSIEDKITYTLKTVPLPLTEQSRGQINNLLSLQGRFKYNENR